MKQHLTRKIGQGQHPSAGVCAHSSILTIVKRARSPAKDWPEDVPRPPMMDRKRRRGLLRMVGRPVPTAFVELTSLAAHQKANKGQLDPELWCEHIGPISDQLNKDLLKGLSKTACVHLDQVKNHDPLEMQLSVDWSPDDIIAYVTSRLGINFTPLGTQWVITYRGVHVNQEQQWLHFGVVFSPGTSPRSDVQELTKIKGVIQSKLKVVEALAQIVDSTVVPAVACQSHGVTGEVPAEVPVVLPVLKAERVGLYFSNH